MKHYILAAAIAAVSWASPAQAITTIDWERDDGTGVSIRFRGIGDLHPTFEEKTNFSLISPSGLWRLHTVAHAAFLDTLGGTEYLVMGIDASLDYLPLRAGYTSFLIPNYEDDFDPRDPLFITVSVWEDQTRTGWHGRSSLMLVDMPDLRDNRTWEWEAVHHLRGPSLLAPPAGVPDTGPGALMLGMALLGLICYSTQTKSTYRV